MKKTLFIIAACATAAVSCQKEMAVENGNGTEEILTVSASIAQFGDDTKTSIDGTATTIKPVWSADDEIKLFNTDGMAFVYKVNAAGVGQSSADFSPVGEAFTGTFAGAYYPASKAAKYSNGEITVGIPSSQVYVAPATAGANAGTFANGAFPMIGSRQGEEQGTMILNFKNVFGLVQLNFTGTEAIKQIDLLSDALISGSEATVSTNGECTIRRAKGAKYVTLAFDSPVALSNTATAFYIAVPADSTVTDVYVTTATSLQHKLRDITPKRSRITSMKSSSLSAAGFKPVIYSEALDSIPKIITGTVWAPVNCGYDAINYKFGKLYQWGRKNGCGYNDGSVHTENIIQTSTSGPVSASNEDASKFYTVDSTPNDWLSPQDPTRWSSNVYDPCPAGWRVPTSDELGNLVYSDWDSSTQKGDTKRTYTFSSGYGTINGLTLPAAGYRFYVKGNSVGRGSYGYYWSSAVNGNNPGRLNFNSSAAGMSIAARAYGYPVRCVKDKDTVQRGNKPDDYTGHSWDEEE